MDLVSFQLNEDVIWIYRRGNEKVWDIEPNNTISNIVENQKNDSLITKKIKDLTWKPDGKCFAVVSTNGLIELFDTMNGTLIRSVQLNLNVSCLKWFKKRVNINVNKKSGVSGLLDDINIINSLPLLKFNTNNTIIGERSNYKETFENESVLDFIIVGSYNGSLGCVFSGIFVVENLTLSDIFQDSEILDIMPTSSLSNHYVLLKTYPTNDLSLLKLNTEFISIDKEFTKILLICSKLLNLIDYMQTSINQINSHYKPYFDYTIRIIELLRGEIREEEDEVEQKEEEEKEEEGGVKEGNENNSENINDSNNADPIYDLYDLLLTGSLSNATKKWLTDYLSDRGIKRWTKLGRTYFDSARSSIYNDLISSLHHMIIFLTDLKGLSQWTSNDISSLFILDIDECIKISQNYLKYSYKFMMELNDSQRYFEQTIVWLSSVLTELTTDEKLNVSFKTNDITKFLMFVSSKLNAVDNGNKENNIHDASKINDFKKILDISLNVLFEKIKNDIKSKFKLDKHSLISKSLAENNINQINMEIFNELNKGFIYLLYEDSSIQIKEFRLSDLEIITHNITRADNIKKNIVDLKILEYNKILTLYEDCVVIYKVLFENEAILSQFKYVLDEHIGEKDYNFQAAYLGVNNTNKTFCVLDKTKKKYIWLSY
ncbi:hypothetical protein C6P40_000667 [Pichia californica]|uniref:Anaphase-promoting complex subunit 4 n=1 Tax=Pichia californica TaxID=460514 RepID=A0A9P6WKP9_9ASCO|nr:hypothetical protein C6P40_000667 [[Candida] californica]